MNFFHYATILFQNLIGNDASCRNDDESSREPSSGINIENALVERLVRAIPWIVSVKSIFNRYTNRFARKF